MDDPSTLAVAYIFDKPKIHVEYTPMTAKTKRTYNLSEETVARVRQMAGRDGVAPSQDGVVELAVQRLYRDIRDREEAQMWARAAQDEAFRAEMSGIAAVDDDLETWPT